MIAGPSGFEDGAWLAAGALTTRYDDNSERSYVSDLMSPIVTAAIEHAHGVVRRLASMVRDAGFEGGCLRSHDYVQVQDPDYLLTIADRCADALVAA